MSRCVCARGCVGDRCRVGHVDGMELGNTGEWVERQRERERLGWGMVGHVLAMERTGE